MNTDVICKIASQLENSADVANFSVATCDQEAIRVRKQIEFDKILKEKMQHFWYGRFMTLLHVHRSTGFWEEFPMHAFTVTDQVCHRIASYFRNGWQVSVCGRTLYCSTRVIDENISITVDLHAPYHSIGANDPIEFRFDITHTSIPLDVDSYRPRGTYSSILYAMYEALRMRSENQVGVFGPYGHHYRVIWDRFVSKNEMEEVFAKCLTGEWTRSTVVPFDSFGHNVYRHEKKIGKDRVICEVSMIHRHDGWTISFRSEHSYCSICPVSGMLVFNGDRPSTSRGFKGNLDKVLYDCVQEFREFGYIYYCDFTFPIHIKLNGAKHMFPTWNELSRISGIGMMTLRKMSTPLERGVFIDFDTQTFRKKKISFDVHV